MSTRSTIVMAVLTFGSIALTAATLVGAYTVMDERAERIFNAEPRAMPAEKRSASARSEGTMVRGGRTQTARGVSASKPRTTAPTERQTVGSAAAAPPPTSQRGNTAETRPAPAAMPEDQPQRRAEGHHGRKPARRLARRSQELQAGVAGASQGAQNGGQSAFFFPFR